MAVPVQVDLNPNTRKVEAALARIKAQAKGVDLGGGAKSIEKLSRPLGKITGQATEFQKSLEASNARVLAFGASVAVINKLSDAFGALVSNTIKVEATFAKINTILGGTQKQLEQFGNGIFSVAQKTATSFDQVAEGALELARQGLSVEESLSRVETALKLVRVAGIDSQQAVAGLTAAIKGFEGSSLTVAQIADKLAEVDTKFAVSTEDLINGLERSSASARVAGVSFDELLGVITTVQERTQRGGAVIGNAFKTIFARLGRTDTLVALDDLGISVLDAQGNVRGAIPLFQELAAELNKLGLKSVEAGEIIQKVAGVRQRDILISLVEDLNSGQSQFAKSLEVSAGAAGALDSKNAQLNNTLESLINNLTVGAQKLSSLIGDLGFADSAKDILKVFSSVVNGITDLLQGDSLGSKFAQGIIKGIGGVLSGPGIALIGAIFLKLFVDLAKFGTNSLKSLLGINQAAEQQNALQKSVLQTLLQNENIQREILALEGNKVAQEQLLLKIYNEQAAALARIQKAAATVTPGLFGAGLRGGEGGVKPKGRASGGYIAAEARDVSRGVGGAPASSKVVSIPNFAFGGGKRGTMVANTSEYIVPNFAGGGDAIFNRDMVRSMGLPAGARKINAAGGYVPNFARNIYISRGTSTQQIQKKAAAGDEDAIAALAIRRNKAKKETSDFRFNAGGRIGVLSAFRGSSSTVATEKFGQLSPSERGIFESVVGQDIKKPSTTISISGIQTKSLENIDRSKVSRFRKNIDNIFAPSLIEFAKSLIGGVGIKNDEFSQFSQIINKSRGNLFSTSVEGGIFESAIQLGTRSLKNISDFLSSAGDEQSPFDFEEGVEPASSLLKKSFGFSEGLIKADAKRTASGKAVNTLIGKSLRDSLVRGSIFKAAAGYIPNFAGGALEEAIGREQAAGLPINQIRINQSGKLRNSKNPMGLAVTNTRDEPTGRIPNFARRGTGSAGETIEESADKFSNAALAASTGLFFLSSALSGAESGIGQFISEIAFAASALTSLTLLKGPIENIGSKLSNFGLDLATNPKFTGRRGRIAGSLGRGIAGVGRALPGIGTAVAIGAVVTPLVLELTKTKTGFEKLNEELSQVDISDLQLGKPEAVKTFLNKLNEDINSSVEAQKSAEELGAREGQTLNQRLNELVRGLKNVPEEAKGEGKEGTFLRSTVGILGQFETQKLIDQSRLTPKEVVRKRVEARENETGFAGFLNKTLDSIFGGADEEFAIQRLKEEAEFKPEILFDAEEFKKAVKEFSESSKKVTDSFLTKAEKEVQSGKFGEGAKIGAVARTKLTEQLTAGRFAAGGFDTQKQIPAGKPGELDTTLIVTGGLSKIREKEFELAKALTTQEQIRLENQIALEKFAIDASKERFKITEDYVKSIEDGTVFRKEEFELIKGLVKEGKDLEEIETALLGLGFEMNVAQKESFKLALDNLAIKNQELAAQEQEIENQNKINSLKGPQGFREGFKKGLGQVREDIDFFADELGEQIPTQFSNNLGAALKDAVSEAKTLDEALSDAGRNFLGFMRDAFLQQAADQFTNTLFKGGSTGIFGGAGGGGQQNIFSSIGGLFGGGKGAEGATAAAGGVSGGGAASGGGFFSKIGGFFGDLFGGGKKGGGAPGSSPTNPLFVQDVANAIGGGAASGAEKALEGITGEDGESAGEGLFSKLKSGFGDLFGGLKDKLGGIFGGLKESLGGLFGGGAGGGGLGGIFSNLLGGGGLGGIFSNLLGSFFGGFGGFFGFNKGGAVPSIRGYANGGSVGSTDTVPAMLTPGEFVVKKSAVDKYGTDFLSSLNRGILPMQGFQNGGSVSPVSSEAGSSGIGGNQINNTSDFTFNIQDGKVSQEGGQASAENQREFASRIKSAITTVIQEESRTGGSLNYLYKR